MQHSLMSFFALVLLGSIGWVIWASPSVAADTQVKLWKTDVEAAPEKLFSVIEDFHNWAMWSPHERDDPAVRRTYGDLFKGKGASYEWDGDKDFGAGRAQIAEAEAPNKLIVDLDLIRPMQGHLRLNFTLERTGTTTNVGVSTDGPADLVKYVTSEFFDDSMILVSCATDGSPKKFCDLMKSAAMKRDRPE